MPLVAQKTSEIVPVQIHSEYRAIIRLQKSDHEMLHLRENGEPWTYEGFKTAWQREMNRAGVRPIPPRAPRILMQNRKNAVNALLEVGLLRSSRCCDRQHEPVHGASLLEKSQPVPACARSDGAV